MPDNMLDKMLEEYKDFAELQHFAQAQIKTIMTQSKKIQELENELFHLKSLLVHTAPVLDMSGVLNINDDEMIARTQLKLLRDRSDQGQLTLEETKKVETYSKIVNQIENRAKKDVLNAQGIPTEELLKQLNNGNK